MTAIKHQYAAVKRPGELGVHSLNHFALTVPDMAKAEQFYQNFGLETKAQGNYLGLHTFGRDEQWGYVTEGARKQLHHLSFGIFEEDLEGFKKRVEDLGVKLLDPPKGLESNALWFRDPDGTLVEVKATAKSSPNEKQSGILTSSPPGVAGAPATSRRPTVTPTRLAHVLLFTTDVSAAIAFYSRVVGLRLSDRSGNEIAFMHGIHGSDHHMIAFAKSNAPGLHHCSWDVNSINDIGLGAMQMADKGHTNGWGLGRHVLGSNYFHYVQDPWGSYSEYSCDMDYIPSTQDWVAGDHPGEDSFYVWGPRPPADWTVNYESDQT